MTGLSVYISCEQIAVFIPKSFYYLIPIAILYEIVHENITVMNQTEWPILIISSKETISVLCKIVYKIKLTRAPN